jgi:hypothetical protein
MRSHTLQSNAVNKLARRVGNLAVGLEGSGFVPQREKDSISTSVQTDPKLTQTPVQYLIYYTPTNALLYCNSLKSLH